MNKFSMWRMIKCTGAAALFLDICRRILEGNCQNKFSVLQIGLF